MAGYEAGLGHVLMCFLWRIIQLTVFDESISWGKTIIRCELQTSEGYGLQRAAFMPGICCQEPSMRALYRDHVSQYKYNV